jgi:archaellum component FlaC
MARWIHSIRGLSVAVMTHYPDPRSGNPDSSWPRGFTHRRRHAADQGNTSGLFWMAVLMLGGVSLLCISLGATHALPRQSEKPLQPESLLPKLKSNLAQDGWTRKTESPEPRTWFPPVVDVSASLDPSPFESPVLPMPTMEPPQVQVQHPAFTLPVVAMEPARFDVCLDPVVYVNACVPLRGETPMIRNWEILKTCAFLALTVPVLQQPIYAFGGGEQKSDPLEAIRASLADIKARLETVEKRKTPIQDNEELLSQINKLDKTIRNQMAGVNDNLQSLTTEVQGLKKSIADIKADVVALQGEQLKQKLQIESTKTQIDLVNEQIAKLQKKFVAGETGPVDPKTPVVEKANLEDIRLKLGSIEQAILKLAPGKDRIAMSPPTTPPATNTGRVVLVNMYSEDMLYIVNGRTYRVAPNASRVLEAVPAGTLTYEVVSPTWGSRSNDRTVLGGNETFTISATR